LDGEGRVTVPKDAARPGWLGPVLWAALLRHAIPVGGVLLLGWLPLDFLLYFVIETWLFLTLRMGVEGALNRSFGPVPETLEGKLGQIAVLTLMSGVVMAIVLGLVGVVVKQLAFSAADWRAFVDAAVWRTPPFLAGLLLLLIDQVWEAARFGIRIAPLPKPDDADDRHLQRVVLRITFLAIAGIAAGVTPAGGAAGRSIVVGLAAAMVMLEAWPEEPRAAPAEGAVSASAGAAAAPRTSRRRRGRSRRG
jgi:hypothetical protein